MPLICLETAQPAKFAATIREALGEEPELSAGFKGLADSPERFEVFDADIAPIKAYIAAHAG